MKMKKLRPISLTLFDGGAGGAEGGAESPATEVIYGKRQAEEAGQADDAGQKDPSGQEEASGKESTSRQESLSRQEATSRQEQYERMLEEYRDLDQQRLRQVTERLGDYEALKKRSEALSPVVELLMDRYQAEDLESLAKAIEEDDASWESAAEERGMTVEQYRQFRQIERENQRLHRMQQRREGEQRAERQVADWCRQGEQVKQIYPAFDLRGELQNHQFTSLLKAGIPVQHAYEVLHMDEIKTGVASFAAQATEHKVVENIRAKGARPAENGAAGRSGITVKSDVHSLSKADRREIARRVARGETITF